MKTQFDEGLSSSYLEKYELVREVEKRLTHALPGQPQLQQWSGDFPTLFMTIRDSQEQAEICRIDGKGYDEYFLIEDIDIVQNYRDQGLGRLVIGNVVNAYNRVGYTRFCVSAMTDGSHIWPRFGFLPQAEAWNAIREESTRRLARKHALNAFEDVEKDDSIFDALQALLDDPDPKAMMLLGDVDRDLSRYVLYDIPWDGYLDLCDHDQSRRFCATSGLLPSQLQGCAFKQPNHFTPYCPAGRFENRMAKVMKA